MEQQGSIYLIVPLVSYVRLKGTPFEPGRCMLAGQPSARLYKWLRQRANTRAGGESLMNGIKRRSNNAAQVLGLHFQGESGRIKAIT